MNSFILIDGENFVHSIVRVLESSNIIGSRRSLKKMDINSLLSSFCSGPAETFYYTTRIQTPSTASKLYKTVEEMRIWNSYWVPYIANQNVSIVKAGVLKARDAKRCKNCRHKAEVLIEKGVDVRLGADVVALSEKKKTIYLVSSDSDLIPAVLNARKLGARVVYIAFEACKNYALSKSANNTITIKDDLVVKAFKKVNK